MTNMGIGILIVILMNKKMIR